MKKLHIAIIILGACFVIAGAIHTNLWFDEAYSVGIINQPFLDLINIGIADVHPLLYYLVAKLVTLPFANSIMAIRIFRNARANCHKHTRIYTYKKRLWRKSRDMVFIFNTIFANTCNVWKRNKNVHMGNVFSYTNSNIRIPQF